MSGISNILMTDSQELNIVIMPNGFIQPEWTDTEEPANETGRLLQEEIFRRFSGGTDLWLLSPGFCDNQTIFSPSLDFWHNFAGLSLAFLNILKSDQKNK
ncbi:MAG: hypothetical protein J7L16_10590 [Deltaproteobacteria bacterium]|nr:hypothetical protein [Deltaproteobacteria bacterium]